MRSPYRIFPPFFNCCLDRVALVYNALFFFYGASTVLDKTSGEG